MEINISQYPKRDDFPGWNHAGYHEITGKDFWNYFHYSFNGELRFHDSPDFSGTIFYDDPRDQKYKGGTKRKFYGDIGKVSPIAMLDTMYSRFGNPFWVSVSDNCQTIIVLEDGLESEASQKLNERLMPILEKNHLTAHILYENVFIEIPQGNVYIGDDYELSSMPYPQIKKRIELALSGQWKRKASPYPSLQQSTAHVSLNPSLYTPQSLWEI